MTPAVSINLVVLNGERYILHFLDSLEKQTYPHDKIQFNVLDNDSADNTKSIIREFKVKSLKFKELNLIKSEQNLGMWPGQEELLKYTDGKYVVASAVDIILDKDFIKNSVEAMEKDDKIGALQPKIYKFDVLSDVQDSIFHIPYSKIIDTCGFQIFRSRRVINIGHGLSLAEASENKEFDFNKEQEIFAVEGAVPVFRKSALESCRINIPRLRPTSDGQAYSIFHIPYSEIVDHNYFWYGDDLDLAWRMRLFGWKQIFAPDVVAWHDRQTTKSLKKEWSDYITRVPVRKQIPIKKRRLDWRNNRWTLIKNDYIVNILKDLPWIVSREIAVLGYAVLFEPGVLKEIPTFFRYLPKMLHKRKEIMKKAVVRPKDIRVWFK